MRQIVRMTYGSHLYGTSTPTSDQDYKGVFIPSARDILLQRVRSSYSERTKAQRHAKNTPEDVDFENFALHKFFGMLSDGSSTAYEMLFAPNSALQITSPEWREVQDRREDLISLAFADSFVNYMRRQAAKYGVKGSRMATVRAALTHLDYLMLGASQTTRLSAFRESLEEFSSVHENSRMQAIPHPSGIDQVHWEVVGRRFPLGLKIGDARRVLQTIFDNFGSRTRQAEANDGVDWKAMSHAVRAGGQALELLRFGHIRLPRPNTEHLVEIKEGHIGYKIVEAELEGLIEEVKSEAAGSDIRPSFDWGLADEILLRFYHHRVVYHLGEDL